MTNEIAVFGGGCFWCTEAVFSRLKGVVSVSSGFAGGTEVDPTYEDVASGMTSHAEVIKIEFDPSVITYKQLLEVFFTTHDPTTKNRQMYDVGTQYRSIVLYTSEAQKKEVEDFITYLTTEKYFKDPITTEVVPMTEFYVAGDYHKNYFDNNKMQPYCQIIIDPKISKLRESFKALLK